MSARRRGFRSAEIESARRLGCSPVSRRLEREAVPLAQRGG